MQVGAEWLPLAWRQRRLIRCSIWLMMGVFAAMPALRPLLRRRPCLGGWFDRWAMWRALLRPWQGAVLSAAYWLQMWRMARWICGAWSRLPSNEKKFISY